MEVTTIAENTNMPVTENEEYLIVVHGVIPEAMPPVAYRRVGRPELVGRKLIKCPYCRELLTHVERHTLVQIYAMPKGKKKKPFPGLMMKQCSACKEEVGIIMTK